MHQSAHSPRARTVIAILVPISASRQYMPIHRGALELLRNRIRRRLDRLLWSARLPVQFHYSTWQDRTNTNRGDIAIRLAARALLDRAFGGRVEFIDIDWHEVEQIDPERINAVADLFVVCGGGYYFLDGKGRLSARIARDLKLLRALRCPIVSFAAGVNRVFDPAASDSGNVLLVERGLLASMLELHMLSSTRDDNGLALLDAVAPGRARIIADPALFLTSKRSASELEHQQSQGATLRIGINIAFHGSLTSTGLRERVELIASAMRLISLQRKCVFLYFVHYDSERLIPFLLRTRGVPIEVVDTEPEDMLGFYRTLDLHICQMLHSSIFSFNAEVPTINIGYDVKNAAFFRLMRLSEYSLSNEALDVERLIGAIRHALSRTTEIRRRIRDRKDDLWRDIEVFLAEVVALALGHNDDEISSGDRGLECSNASEMACNR